MITDAVSQPPFPLEVWSHVLHNLAPLVMSPYDLEDIDTIPAQRRIVSWETGQPRIKDWLALRLVCRAWSHWKWVPFVAISHTVGENDPFNHSRPIQWAHIDGTDTAISRFLTFRRHVGAANRLETLSVSLSNTQQAQIILSAGQLLPSLRNLSLSGDCLVESLWDGLQSNFERLRILRLCGISTPEAGVFTLPCLEMLDLSQVKDDRIERLILPALKHLSTKFSYGIYLYRVISDYGHQLVSISCPLLFFALGFRYLSELQNRTLWDRIPMVRVLDLQPKHLIHLIPPPSAHPLRHLVLQLSVKSGDNPQPVTRNVLHALETFKNIRGFWIDTQGLSPWERFWIRRGFTQASFPWTPLPAQPYPADYTTVTAAQMLITRWIWVHVFGPLLLPVFHALSGDIGSHA